MKRLFNSLRTWLIHKLGGVLPNEQTRVKVYTADRFMAIPIRSSFFLSYSEVRRMNRNDEFIDWAKRKIVQDIADYIFKQGLFSFTSENLSIGRKLEGELIVFYGNDLDCFRCSEEKECYEHDEH